MSKIEQWQKTIEDWKLSGLSQKSYCQNHNLKIHTLYYWVRKLKEDSIPNDTFIQFTPKTESTDLQSIKLNIGYAQIITSLSLLSEVLLELDHAGFLYDPA